MTAKQMAENAKVTDANGETVGHYFCEETVTLEAFCDQYAEEQRMNCLRAWGDVDESQESKAIKHAKQPEL